MTVFGGLDAFGGEWLHVLCPCDRRVNPKELPSSPSERILNVGASVLERSTAAQTYELIKQAFRVHCCGPDGFHFLCSGQRQEVKPGVGRGRGSRKGWKQKRTGDLRPSRVL
ncbi:hypothetical protein SKAU_G00032040 [Synaphobranchus kaupii]|uniref:Uncharacterized protein n=1 Tax=Synaphobranchus kaupii TaxID=118154 RepID=A0A9Q1GDU4_SYNKA|nr:hypothetical protein SKAU_G00032040 [Synaphobranchus kaupii]